MRRFAIALILPALLASFLAAPVAAVDAADYLVWRWDAPGPRGLGLIKAGPGKLLMEATGLPASSTLTISLNSVGCSKPAKPANNIARRSFQSNSQGASYLQLELENTLVTSLRSVRLFNANGQLDCAPLSYQAGGSPGSQPMESLSINFYSRNGMHFASVVDVENDEVHWVGHDFLASDEYTAVATKARCPKQPSAITLQNTLVTSVKGTFYDKQSVDITDAPTRSIQIFHGSTRVACSNSIVGHRI